MADSQAKASTELLQQINGLLSRPLGDRAADRTYVAQREQLKQWRSELMAATDSETIDRLTQACRQLLLQMEPSLMATMATDLEPPLPRSFRQEIAEALAQERATLLAEMQRVLGDRLEIEALEQRKAVLQAEIDRLEAERLERLEEFKRQQRLQQEALTETLARLQQMVPVPPQANPALVEQVQNQTDRFLLALDVMFANTFRSLEDEMQGYRYSVSRKLEQMRDLEQTGEALLAALVDRLARQVRALPAEAEDELAQVLNSDWAAERLDENAIGNLIVETAAEPQPEPQPELPRVTLPPDPSPAPSSQPPSSEPVAPPPAAVLAQLLGEEAIASEMDTAPQLDTEVAPEETVPVLTEPPLVPVMVSDEPNVVGMDEDESLILLPPEPAPVAAEIPPDLIEALQFDLAHPEVTEPLPESLPEPSMSSGFADSDLDAALALLDLPALPAEELTAGTEAELLAEASGSEPEEEWPGGLEAPAGSETFSGESEWVPELENLGAEDASLGMDLGDLGELPELDVDLFGEETAATLLEASLPEAGESLAPDLFLEGDPPARLETDLVESDLEGFATDALTPIELGEMPTAEQLPAPEAFAIPSKELDSLFTEVTTPAANPSLDPLLTEGLTEIEPPTDLDALLDLTEPTEAVIGREAASMNNELENELDSLLHNLTEPELPKREQFDPGEEDFSETLLADPSPTAPTVLDHLFEVPETPPLENLDDLLNVPIDRDIDHDKLNRFADDVAEAGTEAGTEPAAAESLPTEPTLWELELETSTISHIEDRVPPELDTYSPSDPWFLGLDFGQRSVRAALSNVAVGKVYPLTIEDMAALPNQIGHPDTGFLSEYTQLLRMGVPYRSGHAWQPVIQWSPTRTFDLQWLRQEVELLLTRLGNGAAHPRLPESLPPIAGVAFGMPTDWPDTYAVNLREALLRAGLVASSERAIAVEQPLALFLHLLHSRPDLTYPVLILDAGTLSTQLLLARGPERPLIGMRGFDYGGSGLNEDIAARLLYPYWRAIALESSDPCHLDGLTLPNPGDADPARRVRLRQALNATDGGRDLLIAAETVKMTLTANPHLTEWRGTVGDMPVVVLRREFDGQILQPYVQRINREINLLLSTSGLLAEDVAQIWLTGETSHQPTLLNWLQQKFPQVERFALDETALASGLAVAPRYRQLLDLGRQQYSDYFLLYEICRLNPKTPFHVNRLLQQLQARGINIKTCRDRLLDLLQGEMPRGLLPWLEPEGAIVLDDPALGPELRGGRLFELETDGSYRPNVKKLQQLRAYLQTLLSQMQQSFEEPAVFPDLLVETTA